MKIRTLLFSLVVCFQLTQSHGFANYFSDLVGDYKNFSNLGKQKDQIVPQIMSEIMTPKERSQFHIEIDRITSTSKGMIQYGLVKEAKDGSEERIYVKIFHADKEEKEQPYASVEDWIHREKTSARLNALDGLRFDIEKINSENKDVTFVLSRHNPGEEEQPRKHAVIRAVFYQGRIFLVEHFFNEMRHTSGEQQKWVNRLNNLTYLNNLAKLDDQPSRMQTSRTQNRNKYRK